MIELSDSEARVLGCLIEKSVTTPDVYPLSLNSLRLACNQTTNRDPVVHYDDDTIEAALEGLRAKELARRLKNPGERAVKHRHVAGETLELDREALALVCVLLLRGAQTVGELKQRADRLHEFASLNSVEAALASLSERSMVEQLERRPGQKESRWTHCFGDGAAAPTTEESVATAPSAPPPVPATLKIRDSAGDVVRSLAVDTEHEVAAKVARARHAASAWSARAHDERALMVLDACERMGATSVDIAVSPAGASVIAVITDAQCDVTIEMVGAALAGGATVLFKPATGATAEGLALVDALHEVGVPVDVVQCVIGGAPTGAALVRAEVDLVRFTGEYDSGIEAARAASERATPIELSLTGRRR